jgi:hypothetical protein
VPLDEMSSSRATPLTVTPVGVALAVVASRPAQASASMGSLTQRRGDAEIGFWFLVSSSIHRAVLFMVDFLAELNAA